MRCFLLLWIYFKKFAEKTACEKPGFDTVRLYSRIYASQRDLLHLRFVHDKISLKIMLSERLRRFICSEQNQAGKSLIMAGNTAKKAGASDTELAKKGFPECFAPQNILGRGAATACVRGDF